MQIKRLVGLLVIVYAVALSGCARLAFYSDPKLEGPETGVNFYYSKPYLLVARADDKKVQVSVQYLPDLSRPVYAKLKTGYGSADLSLTINNGMLTNVGQKTDTKIPETLNALASMATAAGGLKLGPAPPAAEKPDFTLYEIDNSSGTTILKKVAFP